MFHSLDLFILGCLFLTVESQTGKVEKPQNLSLSWITGFHPQLSWTPARHSMSDCFYTVNYQSTGDPAITSPLRQPIWTKQVVMKGGFLHLSVQTDCNGTLSEPAVFNVTDPALVKNWTCYYISPQRSYCSWEPATDTSNVSFYYRLENEGGQAPSGPSPVRECPRYKSIKGSRLGCDLKADYLDRIYILFMETRGGSVVRNTFDMSFSLNVRPPRLNWTIHKTEDKFNISWTPPDIGNYLKEWKYLINYTECKETKIIQVGVGPHLLDRVPHCPYRVSVKARHDGSETPWSEERRFDADTDPNLLVYAAFIIPLMFAGLAVLTFVCCRKNKENIFPKVPQPRDLLSDISNNNNKSTLYNLYVPAKEEEHCKVTLVMDR